MNILRTGQVVVCLLDFARQWDGVPLKLFRQLVNEIDLPFESLDLPGPQGKCQNRDETQSNK
jgi:hypothetical protein